MIACWPGKIDSSTRTNSPVVVTDLYPTFLDVAGIPLHPENHIDGFSFAPLLANKDYKRPAPIFWHSPKARPYSTGDYNCSAVVQGKYKLLEWYQDNRVELFDVENDISESKDISADYPEVKKQLLKSLHEWKKEAKVNTYKLRTSAPKKSKH
jgi:arylsulfatase A-like enzyme